MLLNFCDFYPVPLSLIPDKIVVLSLFYISAFHFKMTELYSPIFLVILANSKTGVS